MNNPIELWAMMGPRQVGGVRRWLGFASRASRDAARRAVVFDGASWDTLRPDAIIDIQGPYRHWEPVRGTDAACAALLCAIRKGETK